MLKILQGTTMLFGTLGLFAYIGKKEAKFNHMTLYNFPLMNENTFIRLDKAPTRLSLVYSKMSISADADWLPKNKNLDASNFKSVLGVYHINKVEDLYEPKLKYLAIIDKSDKTKNILF